MANTFMPKAKEKFLGGDLDWDAHTFKWVLIDTADYTFSSAHEFLSDVPAAAREETSVALGTKTKALGVADSADLSPTFPAAAGDPCEALYLVRDTGVAATSELVVWLDTGVTGLPVTLNGGDVNIVNHASGIFAI